MTTSPDYSSPTYWSTRFSTERNFEWLGRSDAVLAALDPVIDLLQSFSGPSSTSCPSSSTLPTSSSSVGGISSKRRRLEILHFGCGTSSLGIDLSQHLRRRGVEARVVDADYVADSLPPRTAFGAREGGAEVEEEVELIALDVLDPSDLSAKRPSEGWDLILDKSTADAISCGPDLLPLPRPDGQEGDDDDDDDELVSPIRRLCATLAASTRTGGMWVCVSYSSSRFDHLPTAPSPSATPSKDPSDRDIAGQSHQPGWILRSKSPLIGGFDSDGIVERLVPDGKGGERVIWEPETGAWVYILERV